MKVTAECIPCYLTQCIKAMEKGGIPEEDQGVYLTELLSDIAKLDVSHTPAENSSVILQKLAGKLGGRDLFAEAKRESNRLALQQLPRLEQLLDEAVDPLFTAVQVAVAGNVVDLGLFEDYDLEQAISDALNYKFARSDYEIFRNMLDSVKNVFIIGDNSGEIVFDRLLVRALQNLGKQVTYGVKGGFILNDATMEDARQSGIDQMVKVLDSGCNYLGTLADKCSSAFTEKLGQADMIISKGQANYESLEGTNLAGSKTFFLLKSKCPVVTRHLNVSSGDLVFIQNKKNEL